MAKKDVTEQEQATEQEQVAKQEQATEQGNVDTGQQMQVDEPVEVTDSHGQPGINRDKYRRDIKERDDKIAQLEAQLEEKAKTEQGRNEVRQELENLKATFADEKLTMQLEMAGCKSPKAAKALLEDYDGDISQLKEAERWLFETRPKGSTGLKPVGVTKGEEEDAKLDRAFGIKK